MATKRSSIDEIQSVVDEFASGLTAIQREQFDKIYLLLKDLSLDKSGNIRPTIANLKIIDKVKNQLNELLSDPVYQNKIIELQPAIEKVKQLQTQYYLNTFKDFTIPKTVAKLQELSLASAVDQLAGAGVNENVLVHSADIVEQHIREGSSFSTMVDNLKTSMVGDKTVEPRLVSYAKQIVNDTLSMFSRDYHSAVTDDLGLEWHEYLGALIDTSRPICIALVAKKYIHKSELASIARGIVDGRKVSTAGMMPGTNGQNICSRCGGYNCTHQMIPVPSVVVPTALRRKFEKNVKADEEELTDARPKRK